MEKHPSSHNDRSLSLLITTSHPLQSHILRQNSKEEVKKKKGKNKWRKRDYPLLLIGSLCLPWSRRSSVTFMPKKTSAPAAPSPGFSTPSLSLKIPFSFFFLQHLLFSPSPSPLIHCLPSSFHTLIACISHRSPLANCIILMVFFMIILCGKLTFHAAY